MIVIENFTIRELNPLKILISCGFLCGIIIILMYME